MADPIALKTNQQVKYKYGKFWADEAHTIEAKIDGPPITTVISGDGGTIVEDADGMSGSFQAAVMVEDAPAQVATVEFKADANRDPNVKDFITTTRDFVTSSLPGPTAQFMDVEVGAPEPK